MNVLDWAHPERRALATVNNGRLNGCYDAEMVAKMIEISDETQGQIAEIARQTGRAEGDLLREAIANFIESRRVLMPKSDGAIDDPDLAARDIDDWLVATWRPE